MHSAVRLHWNEKLKKAFSGLFLFGFLVSSGFAQVGTPPTISVQPLDQTVPSGGTATFQVAASSSTVMTFKWYRNGAAVSGATNNIYTITNVQTNHAGVYKVDVKNATGTTTSSNAILSVLQSLVANTASITTAQDTATNLQLTATSANGSALTYAIVAGPTNGVLAALDPFTGAVTYLPATNYYGTDSFTFRAYDGSVYATGWVSLTITPTGVPVASMWFSTAGSATNGTSGTSKQIMQFGGVGDVFSAPGVATAGTLQTLPGFAAPCPIRALHFVQKPNSVGTTGTRFTLKPGDLVMVLDPGKAPATVTLNSNQNTQFVATRQDIVVYRPTAADNYTNGTWFMLLNKGVHVGTTIYNVHEVSIVETPTTIGGTTLAAGTFLVAHSDATMHMNIYTLTVSGTGMGTNTQTSDCAALLLGAPLGNLASQVKGLSLLSYPTAFNNNVLPAGTLLVSINTNASFAGVAQTPFDVVALQVTKTQQDSVPGTVATGTMLFRGSDIGLTDASGAININSLSLQSYSAPTLITLAASNIMSGSSLLNASVDPRGTATTHYFRYGLTPSYGSSSATGTLAAAFNPVSVAAAISGLQAGTLYHYCIVAANFGGMSVGQDATFTTSFLPPTASTLDASPVASGSAVLNAAVNPGGAATICYFQYGTTTNYGSLSATNVFPAVTNSVTGSTPISGLAPGTLYHCRVVATNTAGKVIGQDVAFTTTSPAPLQLKAALTSLGGNIQFNLSAASGTSFTLLSTTNIALAMSNWTALGAMAEISPGQYQFTEPLPPIGSQRYFSVRSP